MAGVGLRLLICSAASGSKWVSSRGTVNCIFLGLPVSMVALSVREENGRKKGMIEKGESVRNKEDKELKNK